MAQRLNPFAVAFSNDFSRSEDWYRPAGNGPYESSRLMNTDWPGQLTRGNSEDRTWRMSNHALSRAATKGIQNTTTTCRRHGNEVDLEFDRGINDLSCDIPRSNNYAWDRRPALGLETKDGG